MIDLKSIHSLTDFKRHTVTYLEELKKTRLPMVLTVNGKAELVVFDAEAFQDFLNKIEYVDAVKELKKEAKNGNAAKSEPAQKAKKRVTVN